MTEPYRAGMDVGDTHVSVRAEDTVWVSVTAVADGYNATHTVEFEDVNEVFEFVGALQNAARRVIEGVAARG